MKKISQATWTYSILVVAALVTFATLGFYTIHFGATGISNDPSQWAHFGGYIGGILGPTFAATAAAYALLTLRNQSRANTALQILASVEKQEKLIDESLAALNIKIERGDKWENMNLSTLLADSILYDDILEHIPRESDISSESGEPYIPKQTVALVYHLKIASTRLYWLNELLNHHTQFATNNAMELIYRKKYQFTIKALRDRGWYTGEWN